MKYRSGLWSVDDDLEGALGAGVDLADIHEWGGKVKFFLAHKDRTRVPSALDQATSGATDLIVKEANQFHAHAFDLLGSGPAHLGAIIDWHTDFKTGHRWNPKTYYKRIRPAPYPGGYDIKVPWELSRCQHFVRLGQAYWITDDEKYAREFVAQVSDWIESNPWPWGVNWACTMDVAIRVVNWLWGYAFFRGAPSLTNAFLMNFWRSLGVHGRHIYRNLENHGGFTNNHYLADLVGLVYLGILCPEFKEAAEWRDFGLRELWQEMFKQVYPDGVSFEASIPYHRLAAELFLSPVILCRLNDIPVPDEVMARLEKMLEFVMCYTRPDGTAPQIGDADNGRLHRLKAWDPPEREWNDHRYLLAIGAVLFERQDFAQAAGDQWEEAIWLLGAEAAECRNALRQVGSVWSSQSSASWTFPNGGIHILRGQEDEYLIVDAGPNGQNDRGGHAHNDALSFEFHACGKTWILDPGTYSYTSDYRARHLFRSTAYHNTPVVRCSRILEQHSFREDLPFSLLQQAKPQVVSRMDHQRMLGLEFHLAFYGGEDISIERLVVADLQNSVWIVRDRLFGRPDCSFRVNLHLPNVAITSVNILAGGYLLEDVGKALLVCGLTAAAASSRISKGWVAPYYGARYEAPVLEFEVAGQNAIGGFAFGFRTVEPSCRDSISEAAQAMTTTMQQLESWR